MKETTKEFFPNLDGLRFIAFFAVFVNHALFSIGFNKPSRTFDFVRTNFLKTGDLGVCFFFVLSGFLITYLLLKEKETSGKINIMYFYMRRILRIWPVYFVVVALGLLFFPLLNNHIPINFPIDVSTKNINPWLYLTFTANFDFFTNGIHNILISILWSVSVEEQFYLFWPLLIAFVPKKYLLPTFILIIAGSTAFRYFYADGNSMIIKFHSMSCITHLATGAVIAYLATKENFINRIKFIPKYALVITYIIGIIIIPFRLYTWKFGIHYVLVSSFVPILISSFFAFIIMEQNYAEHSFYKISKFKFISSMGKYTYGMYCYHTIVFFVVLFSLQLLKTDVVGMNKWGFVCIVITSLFTTMLVSMLSYHYFESWFLKLKNRF